MVVNIETEISLYEKYNRLKKIIPDLDFDKFRRFQPTVSILKDRSDLKNTELYF